MESFVLVVTPFVLNGFMYVLKTLGAEDMTTYGKRLILAVLALIGVLASSLLTGVSPDMNTVSGFISTILMAFLGFVSAHGTYSLFWKK